MMPGSFLIELVVRAKNTVERVEVSPKASCLLTSSRVESAYPAAVSHPLPGDFKSLHHTVRATKDILFMKASCRAWQNVTAVNFNTPEKDSCPSRVLQD